MKSSEFVFDYVHLLYYKCHKRNLLSKFSIRCNSHVKSWRNKKIPTKNNKIKPFINKHNWKEIKLPSETEDWKKFEKNNVTIDLNVFHSKKEKIYPPYVLKHNSNRKKQYILLMIPNGEKWHHLALKQLSASLRGITSKHQVIFVVSITFIVLQQKTNMNLKKHHVKIIFIIL